MWKKATNSIPIMIAAMVMVGLSTGPTYGEEVKSGSSEGGGYFMVGSSVIDLKALNSKLEEKGYPSLSDNLLSLGGGGYGIIGRVMIGGEGHGLIGKGGTEKGYKTSVGGGYGFFNLGYVVYSRNNLKVYPLIGLGVGGMTFTIVEERSLSFDEILDDPKRGVWLSTGGFLLNLALGTEYLLKLGEVEKEEGGLILGARIGYVLAPFKDGWKMDEIGVSGGPEASVAGPYLRLMIGGGGREKK